MPKTLDLTCGIHKNIMEKRRPHYSLEAIKVIVARYGIKAFTAVAGRGADAMLVSASEAVGVVLALEYWQFYKSMTTNANHRVWQDVYHALCPNGRWAYIKLTLRDEGAVVIQFKEL
jgi:motility quorum-sensing regulator/GCU-specific mRNA interferase toxin